MTTPTTAELLKYADLQMAAEAFLVNEDGILKTGAELTKALTDGNFHSSKFTEPQATEFVKYWTVLDQRANTSTGFSGTLFKYTGPTDAAKGLTNGELVMSFRSTEFADDSAHDNQATNAMEIKETGFAWGQLRDMEAWYQELKNDPAKLGGKSFSVTGYSLGGHLATAFNVMHGVQGEGDPIDKVVTFNGAGIGGIDTSSYLKNLVDTFSTLAANADGQAFTFTDASLTALYERARLAYKDGASMSAADSATLYSLANPTADSGRNADLQAKKVLEAIGRIDTIRGEVARLAGIKSSDGIQVNQVPNTAVGQESLDYQMAVLSLKDYTYAASIPKGFIQSYGEKAYVNPADKVANHFDVMGDTSPSAVSNSQWHIGTEVRVFIEDQPLLRGNIIVDAAVQSIKNLDTKLLVDGYDKNDFGDTHSLVLIVDSLNVQNTLLRMIPESQRTDETKKIAAETLSDILKSASNLRKLGLVLTQGKAEGDVLENVVNALADLALGPGNGKRLKGSPLGGSWAEAKDKDGYTGRESLYALLGEIQKSDLFTKAEAGAVTLKLTPFTTGLASQAHTDFGAFAALYSLSPFALKFGDASTAEAQVGGKWGAVYTAWQADKTVLASTDTAAGLNFSNEWLNDRAGLLERKNYFNANDTEEIPSDDASRQADSGIVARTFATESIAAYAHTPCARGRFYAEKRVCRVGKWRWRDRTFRQAGAPAQRAARSPAA